MLAAVVLGNFRVFLYPIPSWATCKGSRRWDYEDLEQLCEWVVSDPASKGTQRLDRLHQVCCYFGVPDKNSVIFIHCRTVAFLEKHLDVLEKRIFNSIAQCVTIQNFNGTFRWSQETGHTLGWIILELATTVYLSRSRSPKENDFAKQTFVTKLNLLMKNVFFIMKIISLILNNSKYFSPNNDQIVIAMIQDPFKQFYHEMKSLRQLILPLGPGLKTRIQYLKFFNNGGFHY